jgi:hypothetical protein
MDARLIELMGYTAAGLVLATFSVRSMTALRTFAIAGNLMFICYAAFAHLLPVLVLHAVLLPLNLWRLREAWAAAAKGSKRPPRIRAHGNQAEQLRRSLDSRSQGP